MPSGFRCNQRIANKPVMCRNILLLERLMVFFFLEQLEIVIHMKLRLTKSECFRLIYVCCNLFGVHWNSLYAITETNIPKQKFCT